MINILLYVLVRETVPIGHIYIEKQIEIYSEKLAHLIIEAEKFCCLLVCKLKAQGR